MKSFSTKVLAILLIVPAFLYAAETMISDSPAGASAYIVSPKDGDTVGQNVTVIFGLRGMGVAPAGLNKAKTGHHHLIVDGNHLPASDKPMGKEVMHFGGGQTEKTLKLSKGTHTLQLMLGNYLHIPHNPPVMSEKITVTVK